MVKPFVVGAGAATLTAVYLLPSSPATAAASCETPMGYHAGAPFSGQLTLANRNPLTVKVTFEKWSAAGTTAFFNMAMKDSSGKVTNVESEVMGSDAEGYGSAMRYWDGAWVNLWPDGGAVCRGNALASAKGTIYRKYKNIGTFTLSNP